MTLHFPVDASSVPLARGAAAQVAEELGCSDEVLWSVRLAVSEAVTNVILHAHDSQEERDAHRLTLQVDSDDVFITVTVSDEGHGLRPREDSPGMGVGLVLLERACERVRFGTSPAGGLAIAMRFPA